MRRRTASAIVLGAIVGAALRWAVSRWAGPGGIDPALLAVNTAGAALLGYVATATTVGPRSGTTRPWPARVEELPALLGAGLCGALTTWSSLALRTAEQFRAGPLLSPSLWLSSNVVLGLAAAFGGRAVAGIRRDARRTGGV
ncbi:MAG: fluoride efflux transporter FluC [Microthrixaceae bacterium]